MQQKTEINQKGGENSTYVNRETDRRRSNLKSSLRGSIIWSRFFNQIIRETELLDGSLER